MRSMLSANLRDNFNIMAPTDRMKGLQHYVVQETFSQCDRVTDKNLANIVPHGKCSLRGGVAVWLAIRTTEDVGSYVRFRRDDRAPTAKPPPIASEKSTQGYHDITLSHSRDFVKHVQSPREFYLDFGKYGTCHISHAGILNIQLSLLQVSVLLKSTELSIQ